MKMTEEGVALTKRFEGFSANAYRCPAGIWTIGFGHTSAAGPPTVVEGMEVTPAEADEILSRDVAAFAREVEASLRVGLNDAQFSALVSFAYNAGLANFRKSSVLALVNGGDFAAVPAHLKLWNRAKGQVLPGLVKRRAAEAELFLKTDVPRRADHGSMEKVKDMFAGYKTYILAAVTVIGAAAAFLVGDADLSQTIQLVVTALMGAFIRHGVATVAVK